MTLVLISPCIAGLLTELKNLNLHVLGLWVNTRSTVQFSKNQILVSARRTNWTARKIYMVTLFIIPGSRRLGNARYAGHHGDEDRLTAFTRISYQVQTRSQDLMAVSGKIIRYDTNQINLTRKNRERCTINETEYPFLIGQGVTLSPKTS